MVELVDHVRLRRSEATRERDELRGGDLLRAQREHLVVVERALELGERAIRQRLRQVDAGRFDPEARRQRREFSMADSCPNRGPRSPVGQARREGE